MRWRRRRRRRRKGSRGSALGGGGGHLSNVKGKVDDDAALYRMLLPRAASAAFIVSK